MKDLKYIVESLLDDEDELAKSALKDFLINWLKTNYKIDGTYEIHGDDDDLVVDIDGFLYLKNSDIDRLLPYGCSFRYVSDDVYINNCPNLESLEGSPSRIDGVLYISDCEKLRSLENNLKNELHSIHLTDLPLIKNLKGLEKLQIYHIQIINLPIKDLSYCPKSDDYNISRCSQLGSLKGAPKECKYFDISMSGITSLKGAPEKCVQFTCVGNQYLNSLEGGPKECKFIYSCEKCGNLTNLIGAPKKCEKFYCNDCLNLESLEGAPEECYEFDCRNCPNLKSTGNTLKKVRDVFICDFGRGKFEKYAKLINRDK